MNQIHPHSVWIGHSGDSRDYKRIFDQNIKAILSLAAEEANIQPPRDLIYCHFPLLDGAENDEQILDVAIKSAVTLLTDGVPVLVCCSAGMSRAPSVAAAALSIVLGKSLEECLELVVAHHPSDVSPGFWKQVKETIQRKYSKA